MSVFDTPLQITKSMRHHIAVWLTLLALGALLIACGGGTDTADPVTPNDGSSADADTAAPILPGIGQTARVAVPTWDTSWFQSHVIFRLAEELGYTIDGPAELDNALFYTSVSQGDIEFWVDGWFPIHNSFFEPVQDRAEIAGNIVKSGALQGYLIDKATADQYNITSLEDFKNPEIRALFDADSNGLANLTGCDPGWGCELVIEHHLDTYGLRDYIQHDQGLYSVLMADTVARYRAGQSIFFYTWTPNWTIVELVPGEDVVWIEVPFPSLPADQAEFENASLISDVIGCVNDPCQMGFPGNDLAIVANSAWLAQNPALARLFEVAKIPLFDIADQNARMINGESDMEDILRHADEWISANRATVDGWLAEALAASR